MNELLWTVEQGDAIDWLNAQPADSCDLIFASPPYEQARLYLSEGKDLGIARDTEAWVAWMVAVTHAALRVCKGLVCWVVEGQTRNYRYTASPVLLMADLARAGVCLRKPACFDRVGIPGSGGPDWLRNDWEWIVCCTRGGKLPWSDNVAMGHPPKWAPGGEMSHRLKDGQRVNQWGGSYPEDSMTNARSANGKRTAKKRPSHVVVIHAEPTASLFGDDTVSVKKQVTRNAHGVHLVGVENLAANGKRKKNHTKRVASTNGDVMEDQSYTPPVLANPGNSLETLYTADEVRNILAACGVSDETTSSIVRGKVGGGLMGSKLASENEAPFPEWLATFFVRSFCPEAGIVIDPFLGSGTTAAVALKWGRRFRGCDLRPEMVELSTRRLAGEASLFD